MIKILILMFAVGSVSAESNYEFPAEVLKGLLHEEYSLTQTIKVCEYTTTIGREAVVIGTQYDCPKYLEF